jgi:hypothetical protein
MRSVNGDGNVDIDCWIRQFVSVGYTRDLLRRLQGFYGELAQVTRSRSRPAR